MSLQTSFFSCWRSLFGGRRGHRNKPEKENGFGAMTRAFSQHLPKGALAATASGAHSRRRLFSLENTFWVFLWQVLRPANACREAVRQFQAWWRALGHPRASASTAAYCQARARLALATLQNLGVALATKLQRNVRHAELWLGRRVTLLDGTGLSMPDTPQNQARWPQWGNQAPGCGFPVLRLGTLFCLASGALLRYAVGNKHQPENHLVRELCAALAESDIVLADRGFCSFGLLAVLQARKVDVVVRLHQLRRQDFRRGRRLGPDDRVMTWQRPDARANDPWQPEHPALPAILQVRLVRYRVAVPGFRTRRITLATTLLDAQRFPASALAELYRRRWEIETHYREFKITTGADVLRCRTPKMIEKELAMHVIGYNLVRSVMQESAHRHHVALRTLSFKGALDTLRQFAAVIQTAHPRPKWQRQLYQQLLELIAQDLLPARPNRHEPRALKRRPKDYPRLTTPRRLMHIPRRNRSHSRRSPKGLS
jgi:hypothetical protein